ncbi:MAG: hypothetical protein GY787_13860 [Alteromonadales bacterium]|nr:hypothetical protein [Alteromonadales bacterium]
MNLRELTTDQEAILAKVESGDFTLDQVSDHLDMLDSERKIKIENYLHVINRLQSEADTIKAEVLRLESMSDKKLDSLANIKSWLLASMKDGEKHEFGLFKVSRVKGREVVKVTNSALVPEEYLTHHEESWTTNKKLILQGLKKGADIKGAELTTGNPSLRIK